MKSKELIKSRTISYYRNTKVAPLKVSKFDILMGPVLGDKRKHAHIVMGLAKDKLITLAITHSEESLGYKNVALNDNPNKSVPNLVPVEYMLDKNQYSFRKMAIVQRE